MIFNSIRWRLQAWHGLILVAVLTGFGLTAYHVAQDDQMRRIDEELRQRLMAIFPPGPPNRGPEGPGRPDRSREGVVPPNRPPEGPERTPEQPGNLPLGGRGQGRPRFEPPEARRRFDPEELRLRRKDIIEQAGSAEAGQTNVFYYVLWQEDGTVLARSPGAPKDVPLPAGLPRPPEPPARFGPQDGNDKSLSQARRESGEPGPGRGPRGGEFSPRPGFEALMALPVRLRGDRREAFRLLPPGEVLLVGRSIAPDLAAMRRLAAWLGAAGVGVLLFGLAGGWWLATRAIRPIEAIGATAQKIAAGDLSQRINAADTDSELGRLAAVLNSTFARLEAAFAHQARFTSDASHELRTPISVILSQTQTALTRERAAAEYREALEACQRAAQRMRKLTESLLELARLDAGQEPLERQRVDLASVAHECVELVRPLAAERGLELRCELPPAPCWGDAQRLSQVVTNLLTNAIQYNQPHGQVRVSTRAENGAAALTVADTGAGIQPEDLPHIFERFYRADKSRSGPQGRTGLGLAISKAIVSAHGGTLEVGSKPGVGSTFTVRLPAS